MRSRYYFSQTYVNVMPESTMEDEDFTSDSSDMNTNSTMLKITNDGKHECITYFNENGVISTFKRKIKKEKEK